MNALGLPANRGRAGRGLPHRAVCGVLVAITALLAAFLTTPGNAVADSRFSRATGSSDCPAAAGVFLPGTWETNARAVDSAPVGLLGPVATQLAQRFGGQFAFRFPGYAASAFDRLPYGDSKETGVAAVRKELTDFATRCPATKFVLAGYSQGSDAMGDVAASIGCSGNPIPADRVLAVGLIADPHRGTAGAKFVGAPVSGQGITGARPGGFCGLSGVTAEICAGQDLYCSMNAAQHPVLAGLGRLLSQPSNQAGQPQTGAEGGGRSPSDVLPSLVSNFADVRLSDVPALLGDLSSQITSGHPDPARLSRTVDTLSGTLRPLGDLAGWASANPGAHTQLSGAPAGTPNRVAGQLLDAASHSDLKGALDSLASIGSQVAQIGAGHAGTGDLANAADRVAAGTAPVSDAVSASPAEVVGQASQVLSVLKPSVLVGQVANVAVNGLKFAVKVPDVLDLLNRLVGVIGDAHLDIPGKLRAAHDLFGQLNTAFTPLVQMAAGVDLHMVSQVIGMIPDTSGTAQIISVLVGVLANLDVQSLATQVGRLQDNVWQIVDAITSGANPVDIATRATALIPTLLGFATIAVDTLTGAAKTGDQAGGEQNLPGLVQSLSGPQTMQGLDSLGTLASDGFSAASFFASGVHQDYNRLVVDGQGRTAVQWLIDWFTNRIRSLGVQ